MNTSPIETVEPEVAEARGYVPVTIPIDRATPSGALHFASILADFTQPRRVVRMGVENSLPPVPVVFVPRPGGVEIWRVPAPALDAQYDLRATVRNNRVWF